MVVIHHRCVLHTVDDRDDWAVVVRECVPNQDASYTIGVSVEQNQSLELCDETQNDTLLLVHADVKLLRQVQHV